MTLIQLPGVQCVVNILQLKWRYACDILTPRVQPQETNEFCYSWAFHVDDRSE
jgi:hypothetical protein